ncbi:hypothetical protein SAMN04488000_1286 [Lentzea albida]|uniref:Uncharacterized protein n=1 Tax=Lentzea albida TaxID=65499 RepID=A0A1H9X754_9PSEU|nr:hypothetical protein SAMN04488000_1286 [Lentzea albida]
MSVSVRGAAVAGVSAGAVMEVSLVGVVLSPVAGVEWNRPVASSETPP